MVVIRSAFHVILAVFVLAIMVLAFSMVYIQGLAVNDDIKIKELDEKFPKVVKFANDPAVSVSCQRFARNYRYNVNMPAILKFDGTGNERMIVVPSISYKGRRERGSEFTLNAGTPSSVSMNFVLDNSEQPPMINRINDQRYDGIISFNQMLLLKGFSVSNVEQFALFFQRAGPCKTTLRTQCKGANEFSVLYLEDDTNNCNSQKSQYNCKKAFTMCGTNVDIEMTGIEPNGDVGVGTPCSDRTARFSISVGEVQNEYQNIELGEDATIVFWKKPLPSEPRECWKQNMLYMDKRCFDNLLGVYTITVKPDLYSGC